MEFKQIIAAFENADYYPRSYSGRAMYGDQCLGVVCKNVHDVIPKVINELTNELSDENYMIDKSDIEEICELLEGAKTDSMGLDSVIYWPGIRWDSSFEDSDEGEEDDEEE